MDGMIDKVPTERVRRALDAAMDCRDYDRAEKLLLYWLDTARLYGDGIGELTVLSEAVGFYRKTGERDKALRRCDETVALISRLGVGGEIFAATAMVNCATALTAFGEYGRAAELFEPALAVYESGGADDGLLGGLYNNISICALATGDAARAASFAEKAVSATDRCPEAPLERAVCRLSLADAVEASGGDEDRIYALLDEAEELLLRSDAPRDGYYAFICDKCAPAFDHYGYFVTARQLAEAAEKIYAGT